MLTATPAISVTPARPLGDRVRTLVFGAIRGLDRLAPLGELLLRLYVAQVFWASGLSKFQSWDTTVLLFEYEYQVPLLPPMLAALFATASELGFSVLLALGLAGRLSAGALFVLNLVAVLSYPGLMEAGLEDHRVWGLMLLLIFLRGPGKASIDHFFARRYLGPA